VQTALRILIIEDEPAIADTLLYALKTEGFSPQWCATGRAGLLALAENEFALVILDIGLPDGSGIDFCKKIRAVSAVPVLFLSARTSEIDRVLALELGGDDYVTKPFSPREITARVKAILRRGRALAPAPAESAGRKSEAVFSHDAERCEVRFHGSPLALTRYEYRLLVVLLARPGRVFSRDELMSAAWEDPGASLDRTVDVHIKTLRAKLRAIAPAVDPIRTHRGLGYALETGPG
jgi:two-component system, OmpR family, catabolic regulation response regulator CreB